MFRRSVLSRVSGQLKALHPESGVSHASKLSSWAGYRSKPLDERLDQLRMVFPSLDVETLKSGALPSEKANVMIENCIGSIGMPVGIAPNFVVNGTHFLVPMAVEEPSIIAACSAISKLVAKCGGFLAKSGENVTVAQIQLLDIEPERLEEVVKLLHSKEREYTKIGNEFCRSMVERGGGIRRMEPRIVRPREGNRNPYVVLHVTVDVREAMGANVANSVAEGLSEVLTRDCNARAGLRILTNLSLGRLTSAKFAIPFEKLGWKGVSGELVAKQVIEAYQFALDDEFRACTNNKGVMNGIDAACIALGQDFRAIEAAAHAYACKDGYYGPMAHYYIDNGHLIGEMETPCAVGSKGGALGTHPGYKITHGLLGFPDSATISEILVCVGLAQNFGAIRALAIEGIQRGHMSLHARNIASSVGVPPSLIDEVAAFMVSKKQINTTTAKDYMEARNIFASPYVSSSQSKSPVAAPSTLRAEIPTPEGTVELQLVLNTLTPHPIHLELVENAGRDGTELASRVFGKSFDWFVNLYRYLDMAKLHAAVPSRSNFVLISQLKLISVLMNIGSGHLVEKDSSQLLAQLDTLIQDLEKERLRLSDSDEKEHKIHSVDESISSTDRPSEVIFGETMITALMQAFVYRVASSVHPTNPLLADELIQEQISILQALKEREAMHPLRGLRSKKEKQAKGQKIEETWAEFNALVKRMGKRWQMAMVLLCDALTVAPSLITKERIGFVRELGEFFEYQATVLHDVYRESDDVNVFDEWLAMNEQTRGNKESLREFMQLFEKEVELRKQKILESEKDPAVSHFFDTEIFLRSSNHIRQYYESES